MTFQHGAVGDDVRLDVGLFHVSQNVRHAIHATAAGAAVKKRVVGDNRKINIALLHFLVDGPDFPGVLLASEALQHRAVDHGVENALAMGILAQLLDEMPRSIWVPVRHHGLDHAADGDAGGLDVARAHLLPAAPDRLHVSGMPVCLDQTAEGVGAIDFDVTRHELPQLGVQEVRLPDAHAGLHHRGEQDLVELLLHVIDQLHRVVDVGLRRGAVEVLQQNRASDLIGLHTRSLHLLDYLPNLSPHPPVRAGNGGVDNFVESDAVRLQLCNPHLFNQCSGLPHMPGLEVGFDEGVVADDVRHAVFLHLLHPCLSLLQLRAFHAGIQDSVVNDAVELSSAALQGLKDVHRSFQVLLDSTAANHRDVLGNIQRILGEEGLCQLAAPALQGGVHDAPLDARVQDGSAFSRCLLAQRGGILLIHVTNPLVVLDLEVEAKESSQDCRRDVLREVLVRLVRESKISRLLAACQECQA
mmetsp:Transcript_61416/g.143697  ORF Transcript_61416/g.143697 Transcript_61416/m.143697 type:complete len:471 (+) Transcript_61416:912-2324(+)